MQKKMNTLVVSTLSLLITNGCTSKVVEKELNQKVLQEKSIRNQTDLTNESDRALNMDGQLTAIQKQQLRDLKNETRILSAEQNSESLKLRSVLMKDLLAANYNRPEITLIKNKLKKVESKKVEILFSAVEKANIILGREIYKHERYLREMNEIYE